MRVWLLADKETDIVVVCSPLEILLWELAIIRVEWIEMWDSDWLMCRRLQPSWDIIVRIGHYSCRMNWNVRQWLVNMCCLFRDTKHLKNDLIFPVMWLNEVWLTVVVTVDSWQYSVSGKIRPPKHVKITLWMENKNYYFFCIMKSHLFAMFVWNLMITSLSIVEILLFIWRWSKIVVTSIAN